MIDGSDQIAVPSKAQAPLACTLRPTAYRFPAASLDTFSANQSERCLIDDIVS
jgi:hypothetical protein